MYYLLAFTLGLVIWRVHTTINHMRKVPSKIPWIGRKGYLWTYLSSQLRSISDTPQLIDEAYRQVVNIFVYVCFVSF